MEFAMNTNGLRMMNKETHTFRRLFKNETGNDVNNEVLQFFDQMLERLDTIELSLQQKADEVVAYQLMQHRSDMADLLERMSKVEMRLEKIEHQLDR